MCVTQCAAAEHKCNLFAQASLTHAMYSTVFSVDSGVTSRGTGMKRPICPILSSGVRCCSRVWHPCEGQAQVHSLRKDCCTGLDRDDDVTLLQLRQAARRLTRVGVDRLVNAATQVLHALSRPHRHQRRWSPDWRLQGVVHVEIRRASGASAASRVRQPGDRDWEV